MGRRCGSEEPFPLHDVDEQGGVAIDRRSPWGAWFQVHIQDRGRHVIALRGTLCLAVGSGDDAHAAALFPHFGDQGCGDVAVLRIGPFVRARQIQPEL